MRAAFAVSERNQTKGIAMQDKETRTALLPDARKAAQMLAVSPRKLWAMTFEEQPGLPYIRCGRLVRYPIADCSTGSNRNGKGGNPQ